MSSSKIMIHVDSLEDKERRKIVLGAFSDEFLEYFLTHYIMERTYTGGVKTGVRLRQWLTHETSSYPSDLFEEEVYPLFRCLGKEGRRLLLDAPSKPHTFSTWKKGPRVFRPALVCVARYMAAHSIKRAVFHYFFVTRTSEKTLRVMARKDGKKDRLCKIRFGPHHHFASAFACADRMREGTLDEWGRFKMMVNKVGTTQDAVRVYCQRTHTTRTNGKYLVQAYLERHSQTSETYQDAWSALFSLASMWPEDIRLTASGEPKMSSIEEDLLGVLEDYMDSTLLQKRVSSFYSYTYSWMPRPPSTSSFTPCRTRLANFCYRNPVIAQVLWESYHPFQEEEGESVFATEKSREKFAHQHDLGKHCSVFKTATSVPHLTELLETRDILPGRSSKAAKAEGPLPDQLQKNLDRAGKAYQEAVAGTPVGFYGKRYYHSEGIELAQCTLEKAKLAAFQWRQKQQTKKMKKPVKLGVA
jgi:hypothetical protein